MSSRSVRLSITLGAALIAASLSGCGSDSKSTDTGTVNSDLVAQGQQQVVARACTSCHKANLAGDTNAQPNSMAYPANLTPDSDTGIGDWSSDTIVNAILNGIDDEGDMLCSPMPKFASEGMTKDQATAIAAYLKSVPAVSQMIPESSCSEKGGS
jgi:mono/diheme cytochrome c family protein